MAFISAGSRFRALFTAISVLTLAGAASWVNAQQASPSAPVPLTPIPAATAPAGQAPAAAPVGAQPAAGTPAVAAPAGLPPAAGAPAAATTAPAGTIAAPVAKPPVAAVAKPAGKVAAKPVDKPRWTELTKAQQQVLQPLATDWDKMEGVKKLKWVEIANRFASMKPDEQQRIHERMRNWAVELTPEQRRVARENYATTKKIDPGKKSAQWEQYQQLPEAEKKRLAAQAAQKKKQVANLPSSAQANMPKVAPIKAGPKPPAMAPAVAPAAVPAGTAPATAQPAATPPTTTAPAGTLPAAPPTGPNGK